MPKAPLPRLVLIAAALAGLAACSGNTHAPQSVSAAEMAHNQSDGRVVWLVDDPDAAAQAPAMPGGAEGRPWPGEPSVTVFAWADSIVPSGGARRPGPATELVTLIRPVSGPPPAQARVALTPPPATTAAAQPVETLEPIQAKPAPQTAKPAPDTTVRVVAGPGPKASRPQPVQPTVRPATIRERPLPPPASAGPAPASANRGRRAIFFSHGATALGPAALSVVNSVAALYKGGQIEGLAVAGYASPATDAKDPAAQARINRDVSMRRAAAVAQALQHSGVPLSEMVVSAYGASQAPTPPPGAAQGMSAQAAARRVEITYSLKGKRAQ